MVAKRTFGQITILLFLASVLLSCSNKSIEESIKKSISTDQNELGKLINLEGHKPLNVKWVYVELDHETEYQKANSFRFNLQAELRYKKETVEKMMNNYALLSVAYQSIKKEDLGFTWLDDAQKKELDKKIYKIENHNIEQVNSYDPSFFKTENLKNGGFILLNDTTILISMYS